MPRQPAPAAEPRHHHGGGAGGAGRGQWSTVPMRIVWADGYEDSDTRVYVKYKALSRGRRATAAVDKVAAWLGVSKSTVERGARRLGSPAADGVTELFTRRRTHQVTGTGQTAERWTRDLGPGERYVSAPVRAADTLRGTLHRLYLLARYTQTVEKRQLTLAEMAWVLRHRTGKRAGQPLADATVSRLLAELDALGWITLERRAGYRGRHLVTVHDDPVRPAEGPGATPGPDDGSGPDLGDGSPAYKEDHQLNDRGRETPAGGSFRRRRDDREYGPDPVDTAGNGGVVGCPPGVVPAALRPARPGPAPYTGPPLTLSPRVWRVLEPVADLLPGVRPFVVRRIAREIGAQLDAGIWAQDIRDQITRLRRWTPAEDIYDPGRWLLGAVLPVRSKCGMPGCHWGFLAHTGQPCKACAEIATVHPPPAATRPGWHECGDCRRPSRHPLTTGLCTTCRPTA
ncbi:hypothetical protein ABZX40_36475 [Streptomyces sp. NPDC004610]|uniref:hypothetical protein n=1 Tax=unclassified Streptomyces TaxID=2593676 RepID=UPI0033BB4BA8